MINLTNLLISLDENPTLAARLEADLIDVVKNAGGDNSITDINVALRNRGYKLANAGTMHNLYSQMGFNMDESGRGTHITLA